MSTPSTLTSRNLRVRKPTLIARMVIKERAIVIDEPVLCEPGKTYRVELDADAGRASITEVAP